MKHHFSNLPIDQLILAVFLGIGFYLLDWIGLAFGTLIWMIVMICLGRFEESEFQKLSKGLTQSETYKLGFMIIEENRQREFFDSPPKNFSLSKAQIPKLLIPAFLLFWLSIAGWVNGRYGLGTSIGLLSSATIYHSIFQTNEIVASKAKIYFILTFYTLCTVLGYIWDGLVGVFFSIIIFWIMTSSANLE